MKFNRSESEPDPQSSFLDIIFCLCVMLCFALANSTFKKGEDTKNGTIHENRFVGRGGQPKLKIVLDYDDDIGFSIRVGEMQFLYSDFRKILCNIERRESDGKPSFLFSAKLTDGYRNVDPKKIYFDLDEKVEMSIIQKIKQQDSNWWIVNVYKKKYHELEMSCRKSKLEFTSKNLGNWDMDQIESKEVTSYQERRNKGKPFIWFTIDMKKKRVVMGPKDSPIFMKPSEFVQFVSSIEGNDGLYIEYRDPNTWKYDSKTKIPNWVIEEIIKPLGYSIRAGQNGA